MKTTKISLVALALLGCVACSDGFLSQYPDGSSLTQEQYESLEDLLQGTALGVYSNFYAYGGSHDIFGERAIDMYGDLLCGDMAMADLNWFYEDEIGNSWSARSGYLWSYYYGIIRSCNLAINAMETQGEAIIPQEGDVLDDKQITQGFYYGQVLALRGYAYASLAQYFIDIPDTYNGLVDYETEEAVPVYDENYTRIDEVIGAPLSTAAEVYVRATEDLRLAIQYLDAYRPYIDRSTTTKIEMNADVARGVLAYTYLNWGDHNEEALRYADELIQTGNYQIVPKSNYLGNGFNDVNDNSWVWGNAVTMENRVGLPSFFGQVDIHTYSYAWAGSVKGIDQVLYDEVTAMKWDGRKHWWRSGKDRQYPYAPDGKFYSAQARYTTAATKIDRDWLSDDVYMRIETAYLIASEACLYLGKNDSAVAYMDAIMKERIDTAAVAQGQYETYKSTLTTTDAIKNALIYNWRVELWGEGYGLQTFRRLDQQRSLGDNHYSRGKSDISVFKDSYRYTFILPSSETRYNRWLNTDQMADVNAQ